jgi:hypothetical protein
MSRFLIAATCAAVMAACATTPSAEAPSLLGTWTATKFVVSVPGMPGPTDMLALGGRVTVTFSGTPEGGTYVAEASVVGIDPNSSGAWSVSEGALTMESVPGLTGCPITVLAATSSLTCPVQTGLPYIVELQLPRRPGSEPVPGIR